MMGKKKEITCRRLLLFFCCCMMCLSWPAMESQAATDTSTYTFTDTNRVQYSFTISSDWGNRAVITSVYVPSGITSITVPDKVRKSNSSTEYLVVGIQGTTSGYSYVGAFKNSGGKPVSITLPDSLCEIYQQAFDDLPNLQTLSLNGDGIAIGYEAFKGCKNLKVTFRGSGAVKYISGYAFETGNSNCLDYNVIKNRVDKNSWIGYDATWNNEAEWEVLVNGLTPFSVSVADDSNRDWEPTFDELNDANGYPNSEQIVSKSTYTSDYNAWIRKSAKWVNSDEEQAEIRLDVAYNPLSSKSTNDMVFVLDVSASMYYGYSLIPGSNYSRHFQTYDQARAVAKALLDLNESGKVYNRVGATMFGDSNCSLSSTIAARGTSRTASGTTDGFFTDYASFIKWLDRENYLVPANTGYSYGLDEAAYLIRNRRDTDRTPSVVFLSDGVPNNGTQGAFPRTVQGTIKSGYGGPSTSELSRLGVTRYSILLGEKSASALEAVTLVAGAPGTSNDSTKTYDSPDADTLQRAFQAILVAMTENLNLNLSDTAGDVFSVSGTPTATGGSVSLSGVSTSWDFSGTEPRQVYTLIIIQDLKRDSNNYNAYFAGEMKTNLGNAVLADATIGEILSVGSPVLNKIREWVTITVRVYEGVAIAPDGGESDKIDVTIPKTGDYTAEYRKYAAHAELESIEVTPYGGIGVMVDETLLSDHETSYTLKDIRRDHLIVVKFWYPSTTSDTWAYYASVENGRINGQASFDNGRTVLSDEEGIPLAERRTVEYSTDDGYKLEYVIIGLDHDSYMLDADEMRRWQRRYQFPEATAGQVHSIHVKYREITETEDTTENWGDYRR